MALLLAYGATVDIHDAAVAGDLERVKVLLGKSPDLIFSRDDNNKTPLHWAAFGGQKDVVEYLLMKKAEVDAKDKQSDTPLHLAAFYQHKAVTE